MGYTLIIGEAKLEYEVHEYPDEPRRTETSCHIKAELVELPDAPAFGEPTDHENQRWPSYGVWANFCREIGIYELMYGKVPGDKAFYQPEEWADRENCLINHHPGAQPIARTQLAEIEKAVQEYRAKHPEHIAQYPPVLDEFKDDPLAKDKQKCLVQDPRYDGNLVRAEWLLFWMKWALDNCKRPVFCNY